MITDIEILESLAVFEARESFYAYRRYINGPTFKIGWWVQEVCFDLQNFYDDLVAGKRPILIIQAPPQHGKSVSITDFITWLIGKFPDFQTIYASFSDRLGTRANKKIQRILGSDKYKRVFPDIRVGNPKDGYTRTKELIEFDGFEGNFRNTTVLGSVTGESLDVGVIDDPIKGREAANSPTVRGKTWDWFTDDFYSRFSENAGLLIILTRWHVDDPVGRLINKSEELGLGEVVVRKYEAIATKKEKNRDIDEPLFPEHKSLEFLLKRKKLLNSHSWDSLYQQSPKIIGGNLFKDEWWRYYRALPPLRWRIIYVDTAQKTKNQHDWSVFQCWGMSFDGRIYLLDQVRNKVEAPQLLVMARAFWSKHRGITGLGVLRCMKVEDKVSGTGLIQTLRQEGIPVQDIQRNIDKISRAYDVTAEIEVGNVWLPEDAIWLSEYLAEFSGFPNFPHDDQVDPTMDAIEDMLINPNIINYEDLM